MAAEDERAWRQATILALEDLKTQLAAFTEDVDAGFNPRPQDGSFQKLCRASIALGEMLKSPLAGKPQPALRSAVAALASEILTANRVLSRRVEGALSLHSTCIFVSQLSTQLLWLVKTAEQRAAVGDLAFRVVSATGAAVLDSGSRGYHQILSAGRRGMDLPTRELYTSQLLHGIQMVVETLHELSTEQPQAFAVLRNTTATPAAVINALRRIPWSKLGETGQSGFEAEQEALASICEVAEGMTKLLSRHLKSNTPFEEESAALANDLELQTDIITMLEPALGHLAGGRCTAARCNPRIGSCLHAVGCAYSLLWQPQLLEGRMHRAMGSPPLLELLWTTEDHVLRMPEADLGEEERGHRANVLCYASAVMCSILSAKGWENAESSAGWVVPHARHAAAVVAEMLRMDAGPPALYAALMGLKLDDMYSAIGLPMAFALANDDVGALAAAEACLRLAAREGEIRTHLSAHRNMGNVPLEAGLTIISSLPPGFLVSPAVLNAVASLVDSFAKVTHVYAGLQAAGDRPWCADFGAICSCADQLQRLLDYLSEAEAEFNPGSQGDALLTGSGLTKRWQALALAVLSALAALARRFEQDPPSTENLTTDHFRSTCDLLSLSQTFFKCPGVAMFVLSTVPARSALLQLYESVVVKDSSVDSMTERQRTWPVLARAISYVLKLPDTTDSGEVALALAQGRILTHVARWAEERLLASNPESDSDQAAYLSVDALIRKACAASGDAGLSAALDLLHTDGMATQPEYWRRLQAEVAQPLAELLTARAKGLEGGEAQQLQQAVATARAVATRKCAHLQCVTTAGPSEAAMPRGRLCSGCRLVRYCGAGCQKADWRAHRAACRELQRAAGQEQAQAQQQVADAE